MKRFRWLSIVVEMVAFGLLVLPPTVAGAAVGEGCPNESLRSELGSGLLAECRAYEMITPAYKEGYPVLTTKDGFAGDGEQAILASEGEFAGNPGGGWSVEEAFLYLDRRTPEGWRLSPLNPPDSRFVGQEPVGEEAQSGETLWVQHTPAQSYSTRDVYIRSVNGEYTLVGPLAPPVEGEGPSNLMLSVGDKSPFLVAATSDYGNILLSASDVAVEGWPSFDHTTGRGAGLYEYSGTGRSQPILVGVTGTEKGSTKLVNTCGIEPGSPGTSSGLGSMYNALSVSGEAVFFTVKPCNGTEQAEVYERLHGALTSPGAAETVDVSASECTSGCGGVSGKEFEGASEDGERVYFTSTQKLTDGAVDGTASGNAASRGSSGEGSPCATIVPGAGGCNLYEYDAGAPVGGRLVLVAGGEVQGVVGIAEDGARVYYVSRDDVPGAGVNEFGKGPVAGADNLYVYDALDGRTVFVATLENEPEIFGEPDLWSKDFVVRPGEVAGSGGQFLLFASDTPHLTTGDTGPLEQLFEYDAETGELVRVTQGENGYNENGNGVLAGIEPEGAISIYNQRVGTSDFHSGGNLLNISGDGRTVAFATEGRLSERATAAERGCTSVYVFHTGGRLSEGSVHLVSDGKDSQETKGYGCGAQFEAMDEDGANILFTTDDSLVAGDTDGGQRDLYDARVDGGFPAGTAGWSCEEHNCEGSTNGSVSAPVFGAPDSTAGTGTGNLPPVPVTTSARVNQTATKKQVVCGKHKRRVHGRCLAPRAKSKQARSRKADGKRRHRPVKITRIARRSTLALAAGVLLLLGLAGGAVVVPASWAAPVVPAPAWQVTDVANPTVLPDKPGTIGRYWVVVENVGGAASSGEFTVSVPIPAGLAVARVRGEPEEGAPVCERLTGEVKCRYSEALAPGGFDVVNVEFEVTGGLGSVASVASVSGGGAAAPGSGAAVMRVAEHEHETGPAGISEFQVQATGPAGEPFTQAAGHPNFLTTSLTLNNRENPNPHIAPSPVEAVKDLVFYLPVGLLGDPAVADTCPVAIVETYLGRTGCPLSSRVGTILAMITGHVSAYAELYGPAHVPGIYNVTPEKGYAAEFAFAASNLTVFIYANVVKHDGEYVLRVSTPGILLAGQLLGLVATFDGDLSEHYTKENGEPFTYDRGAFLTNPSDCEESPAARQMGVEVNSHENPGTMHTATSSVFPTGLEGCGNLQLSADLAAGPSEHAAGDTTEADEPSGYKLNLETPQGPNTFSGTDTPPYKSVQLTLPAGTSLSPGAANGLTACEATGPHGIDFPSGEGKPGNPGEPAGEGEVEGQEGLPDPAPGHCPASSIVGTARASTPLLKEELEGHLYVAEPECGTTAHTNPCTPEDAANGSLFHFYLELEAPQRGVVIKLPGKAHVNPQTGQVTAVFEDTPQFPVSDVVVETTGGPRATLANPQTCGTATTTGVVAPWSGGPAAEPSGSFDVNEGCGAQGFNPSFTAGTTDNQAGEYAPFTMTLKREDREQDIGALSTTLPEGLLASVSHVAKCPEPQAASGACPEASRIGTTTVGIGSGTAPFYQTGSVYFTGPYDGAPFGLSVVVPAVAGPFNLGNVVVRAALRVNPNTTQVTAETPGVGQPGGLPQMIDGVPLRIRTINVTLNDPSFTLNPTNCSRMSITGTVVSTSGTAANVSTPFEANGCRDLPFKPALTASTQAKASREDGASLSVKVASGPGQANISKVQLRLPKALPARLATLKKACTEEQFNANPAGCPAASNIGTATAKTPILGVPLTGPAYLVSHGSAAFPDVEFVLQGEGITIVLDGKTQIKGGYTYSRFETVPDAPISTFETVLPEGPHSALAAVLPHNSYDMCGQALTMPTTIVAQNGAQLTQTTKVAVSGCGKAKVRKKSSACRRKKGKARRACEAKARRRKRK